MKFKAFPKALLFLTIVWLFDFLLRKGFLGFLLPLPLPSSYATLVYFSLFALAAWMTTRWFCRSDKSSLHELGISLDRMNRKDFFIGFWIGLVIWAIVSVAQAGLAGFSWELRPEISLFNILYGLLFIFIADLGTELFTRGYALTKFKDSVGAMLAIWIMTFFVGLKSYSPNLSGELLFYTMIIPALHTVFFSIIYFKTKRLGASLGIHTGANFVTISLFDLRQEQSGQVIPSGVFQPSADLETLPLTALQLPWVLAAIIFSCIVYIWWKKSEKNEIRT